MSDASSIVPGIGGDVPEPEPPEQRQEIVEAEKERQEQEAADFAARSKEAKERLSGKEAPSSDEDGEGEPVGTRGTPIGRPVNEDDQP
jgi:hypothetical protein